VVIFQGLKKSFNKNLITGILLCHQMEPYRIGLFIMHFPSWLRYMAGMPIGRCKNFKKCPWIIRG